MSNSLVFFKYRNDSSVHKIPIQGVTINIKELRDKIKQYMGIKNEGKQNNQEIQILAEQRCQENIVEQPLGLSDKVRDKSIVIIVRQMNQAMCKSCYSEMQQTSTPCCLQPICLRCEKKFLMVKKCFFNLNGQCQFKYHNYEAQPLVNEISKCDLDLKLKNAIFYIVKSNNEINVNLAKRHNVWATIRRNYCLLQTQFEASQNIVLIFTANRTTKYLGCAKIINIHVPRDTTWSWQSGSIQLSNNFSLEWLRKGIIDYTELQDIINPLTGDLVNRSKDCSQIPSEIGIKICHLFPQIIIDQSQIDEQKFISVPESNTQEQQPQEQDDWDIDQILTPKQNQDTKFSPIKNDPSVTDSKLESPKETKEDHKEKSKSQEKNEQSTSQFPIPQSLDSLWKGMNQGKIPGLVGKIQYEHPYLKQMQKQQQIIMAAFMKQYQQANQNSSSRSRNTKDGSRSRSYSSSSSRERRRNKKERKERKERKAKKERKEHQERKERKERKSRKERKYEHKNEGKYEQKHRHKKIRRESKSQSKDGNN